MCLCLLSQAVLLKDSKLADRGPRQVLGYVSRQMIDVWSRRPFKCLLAVRLGLMQVKLKVVLNEIQISPLVRPNEHNVKKRVRCTRQARVWSIKKRSYAKVPH